jgi:hypothetical protein
VSRRVPIYPPLSTFGCPSLSLFLFRRRRIFIPHHYDKVTRVPNAQADGLVCPRGTPLHSLRKCSRRTMSCATHYFKCRTWIVDCESSAINTAKLSKSALDGCRKYIFSIKLDYQWVNMSCKCQFIRIRYTRTVQ